jgi:hypothetical protein
MLFFYNKRHQQEHDKSKGVNDSGFFVSQNKIGYQRQKKNDREHDAKPEQQYGPGLFKGIVRAFENISKKVIG